MEIFTPIEYNYLVYGLSLIKERKHKDIKDFLVLKESFQDCFLNTDEVVRVIKDLEIDISEIDELLDKIKKLY